MNIAHDLVFNTLILVTSPAELPLQAFPESLDAAPPRGRAPVPARRRGAAEGRLRVHAALEPRRHCRGLPPAAASSASSRDSARREPGTEVFNM